MDNPNFEPYVSDISEENGMKEEDAIPKDEVKIPTTIPSNDPITDNHQPPFYVTPPRIDAPISNTTPTLITSQNEPLSYLLKQMFHDPATLKLLAAIISVLTLCLVSPNIRGDGQSVPSFVINGFSLIYSIFGIIITVFWKNQKNIEKCEILKKAFGGRNVYWHEIHSTMTLILAMANLSCVTFVMWSPLVNVIFSLTNAAAFGCDFFLTVINAKKFVVEKKVTKCYLGIFHRHPIKFNILQLECFIAALVFYVIQGYQIQSYFMYCAIVTIVGSSIPLACQLFKRHSIGTWYFSNPKIHTYISIGITIHAFLIVLSNSVDSYCHEEYDSYYGYYNRRFTSFVSLSPISFSLSCIVFVFSLLELYCQAIFNKCRAINESQNPLLVKIEQNHPFRNLPTIIENPLGIEGVKEVYGY